jgi:hypothetical protein
VGARVWKDVLGAPVPGVVVVGVPTAGARVLGVVVGEPVTGDVVALFVPGVMVGAPVAEDRSIFLSVNRVDP